MKPLIELLEERWVPANFHVTGAYLINIDATSQIVSPVLGERLKVKVDYDTSFIPSNATYNVQFSVDGVVMNSGMISLGAGYDSGVWYWTIPGWFAENLASHSATVTVDSTNAVVETDETDNSASFTFTAHKATDLPAKFSWPEDGVPMKDRAFTAYVDLDPTSGIRDWNGGAASYDGHAGLDFGSTSFTEMDKGVIVRAAAAGTVVAVQDFNYDRDRLVSGVVTPNGPPNYVEIDHGNGWHTFYYHLRRDSIDVKVGDTVAAGDVLGFEGSSGDSSGTHLHFQVTHNSEDVETFLDPNTYWISPPPYVGATEYLNNSGITNYAPDRDLSVDERPSDVEVFSQTIGVVSYIYGNYTGLRTNDHIQQVYRKPDGSIYQDLNWTIASNTSSSYFYFYQTFLTTPDVGVWQVDLMLNGVVQGTKTFTVTAAGAPEIKLETSTGDSIPDERFTPFNFGPVSQAAASTTQTYTVINHGSAPLTLGTISLPAGFTLVDGLPSSLAPGAQDTFTVGLDTSNAGYFAGQIRIATNDASESDFNFPLEGMVTGANPTLTVGISERHAAEGSQVLANIQRTGSLAQPLTVNLASSDTTELTAPVTVTIPANQASVLFHLTTMQDGLIDGLQTATVTASATGYSTARNTLDVLDIDIPNRSPTVANPIPNKNATEDSPFSFTFAANTFADPDVGDTLSYSAKKSDGSSLPGWLSFNAATRTFSGTPLNADVGTVSIAVTATDNDGASVSSTFSIIVANTNDAPTLTNSIPDQNATEDSAFSFTFAANTFADVDVGDTLTYSAKKSDGSVLPVWLSFNPATRTFSGTPLNANVGTVSIRVTATDSASAAINDVFDITVANTNDAPTLANAIPNQNATEDAAFSFAFAANTFADVDVGDSLTFTANKSDGSALPVWLTFTPSTRTFSGTPLNADVGTVTLKVIATDGSGASISGTFNLTVANTNDAPTLVNAIPNQNATEDSPFNFTFAAGTFADVDVGDTLTYSAKKSDDSSLPAWLLFNPALRRFSGTPRNGDVGAVSITITATDGGGASVTGTFDISVANTNDAPTLTNAILNQFAAEDSAFAFTVPANTFSDVDVGDSLTYTAKQSNGTALPAWLTFNPATQTFSGTPLNADVGTVNVTVTVTDTSVASASGTFSIIVSNTNDAPILVNGIPNQNATEDSSFSLTFASNLFADVDVGDTLTYSAKQSNGSALPSWLSFTPTTRTFTGTPLNGDVGTVSVSVTATDSSNATANTTFNIVVANTNDAPTLASSIANQNAAEDAAFSFTIPANTFSDVDVGDTLTYSVTQVNGTPLPGWLVFTPASRTFTGTPLNGDVGTVSVTVTVTDRSGASAAGSFNIIVSNTNDAPVVANPIPDANATEDTAFTFVFAANTFTDVDVGDSLTYSAALPDGSALPAWLTFNSATRKFTGTPTNVDVGKVSIRLTATDVSGAGISDTFDITVINTNDAPVISNPIANQSATEDALFNFAFAANTFSDIDVGDSLAYSAQKSDGTPLPGWLSFNPATRTFSGTPLNSDVGTTSIRVIATDSGNANAAGTFNIVVANTNDGPTLANAIPDQNATEDSPFSLTLASNTFADVDLGDTLTYSATKSDGSSLPGWLSFNSATRTFTGTPLNANVGTVSIRVTASDSGNATISDTFDIHVINTNDAPVLTNAIPNQAATEDSAFSSTFATNTFADVDLGDTLSYSATKSDGTTLPGWLSFNPTTRTFSGTPRNEDVGTVSVSVIATDLGNASINAIFSINVANTNDAPIVANPIVDQSATEDASFSFRIPANTFVDVDFDDPLTLSAKKSNGGVLPAWLTFNSQTRTFSGTPLNADVGSVTIAVTATDGSGSAISSTFNILVANSNDAPTLTNAIPNQTAIEDSAFSMSVSANTFLDVDVGDALTYTSTKSNGTPLPGWLAFDPTTRTLSGTPLNADVGNLTIAVTATDGSGASISATFSLLVNNTNDAPTVANVIPDQTAAEDHIFAMTFAANTFADVDVGDTLTYTVTQSNGSALPAWLRFIPATRTFTGTPLNSDVGSLSISVAAKDGSGATVRDAFDIVVTNTNDAPTPGNPIDDQDATEDAPFTLNLAVNTFLDVDLGDTLTYSATRTDGTALPAWLVFVPATRTFSGTPLNADVGTNSIKVTATDSGGASASETFQIVVANTNDAPMSINAIPDGNAIEDSAFAFVFAANTFTDVDVGDSLTYSATQADGTALPGWLSFASATRTFTGMPLNADVGTVSVKVIAQDGSGASASETFSIIVVNTNDAPTLNSSTPDIFTEQGSAVSLVLSAGMFSDVDLNDVLTYTAQKSNGTPLPGWLTFDAASKTFSGTPLNADVGTLSVRVTATDTSGASASDTFDVFVANTNDAPLVTSAISDQTATEDLAFTFIVAANAFTDIDVGDSLSYTAHKSDGSVLPHWLTFNPATRKFSGIPLNGDVGTISIVVTATDRSDASTSSSFRISVANTNDAPIVGNPILAQNATEDTPFTLTFAANTFTDVDAGDSLTYSSTKSDGSPLPGWLTFNSATRTFSGQPENSDVGTLAIKVNATDIGNASASVSFNLTIANINDAPKLVHAIPNQNETEDSAFVLTVADNAFEDEDVGDLLTYSAMDSGGSPLPGWLTFNPLTRTFTGTPHNSEVGTLQVVVIATDSDGLTANGQFDIVVTNTNDAPTLDHPIQNHDATEDTAFTFAFAANTFSDVDVGDGLTYSATKADGTPLPGWLTFTPATRTFFGTPLNSDVGTLSVRLTAKDASNASVNDTFNISVQNTDDAPTAITLSASTIRENQASGTAVGMLGAIDDDVGDTSEFQLIAGAGDSDNGVFVIVGHELRTATPLDFETRSALSIRIRATDSGGKSIEQTFALTVLDTIDPPIVRLNPSPLTAKVKKAILVDANAQLIDTDSTNFGNGSLRVSITAGAASTDTLSLKSSFASVLGKLKYSASKHTLTLGKQLVARVTGGLADQDLVIQFQSPVTRAAAQDILRNLTINGTTHGTRTVGILATDETGLVGELSTRSVVIP